MNKSTRYDIVGDIYNSVDSVVVEITNTMHRFLPLLYSIDWLLRHTGHATTHYMVYHLFSLYFK
jgi:hypothetical protein